MFFYDISILREIKDRGFWLIGLTLFSLFFMLVLTHQLVKDQTYTVSSDTFPVLGNQEAPIEIVVFQEFNCPHCKVFHDEIFEWLNSSYIQTGKVRCTVVPTALLEGSQNGLACALAALEQGTDQFEAFLSFFFHSPKEGNAEKTTRELLSGFFQYSSYFSISRALRFIKNLDINSVRQAGIDAIEQIYDQEIHLPTLLINGKKVRRLDKNLIENMIEREYGKVFHKQRLRKTLYHTP